LDAVEQKRRREGRLVSLLYMMDEEKWGGEGGHTKNILRAVLKRGGEGGEDGEDFHHPKTDNTGGGTGRMFDRPPFLIRRDILIGEGRWSRRGARKSG